VVKDLCPILYIRRLMTAIIYITLISG